MKIKTYFAQRGAPTKADFARRANINYPYFLHICAGRRRPGLDLARRISRSSGGRIKIADANPSLAVRRG